MIVNDSPGRKVNSDRRWLKENQIYPETRGIMNEIILPGIL